MTHPRTEVTYASPRDSRAKQAVIRVLERLTGQPYLQRVYWDLLDEVDAGRAEFFPAALARLGVNLEVGGMNPEAVPREGPLIVIANHPYGVLDGLGICALVGRVRPRFRVLAHALLCREPRLTNHLLPIDFDETPEAIRTNIETKRAALRELAVGGTVIVFPAGGVATAPRGFGDAIDLEWKTFVAKLVQQAKAPVWPVFFHGQNGLLFQLVSQVSLTLRLGLLMHEVTRRIDTPLRVSCGRVIEFAAMQALTDRRQLTSYLRARVEEIGASPTEPGEYITRLEAR